MGRCVFGLGCRLIGGIIYILGVRLMGGCMIGLGCRLIGGSMCGLGFRLIGLGYWFRLLMVRCVYDLDLYMWFRV